MCKSDSILDPLISINNEKSKILPHECRICGAPAEYLHFGVISCLSCKIFFRRNGKAEQVSLIFYFNIYIFYINLFRQNSNVIWMVNVKSV